MTRKLIRMVLTSVCLTLAVSTVVPNLQASGLMGKSMVTWTQGVSVGLEWYRQDTGEQESNMVIIQDGYTWAPVGLLDRIYNDIHYTINTPNPRKAGEITDDRYRKDIQGIEFLKVAEWVEFNNLRVERLRVDGGYQVLSIYPTPESILFQPSSTREYDNSQQETYRMFSGYLPDRLVDGTTVQEWQFGEDLGVRGNVDLFKADFRGKEERFLDMPDFGLRLNYTGLGLEYKPNMVDGNTAFIAESDNIRVEVMRGMGVIFAQEIADVRAESLGVTSSQVVSVGDVNFRGIKYLDEMSKTLTQELYKVVGDSLLIVKVSGESMEYIQKVLSGYLESLS
jgi:hypothetical protein